MKYVIILIAFFMTGCASTPLEKKRENILKCTKDFIELDSGTVDSYTICKDVFTRQNK